MQPLSRRAAGSPVIYVPPDRFARAGQHPSEPATTELVTRLATRPLTEAQLQRFADTIDLSVMLTLSRVTGQVLGPGAIARNPAANEAAAPWLTGLKLGYRIGLVLELLRLSSSE